MGPLLLRLASQGKLLFWLSWWQTYGKNIHDSLVSNVASLEILYKWRFLAGKTIYKEWIFHCRVCREASMIRLDSMIKTLEFCLELWIGKSP